MDRILDDFQEYCSNDIISGKARSYRLAIKYLSEYLNITKANDNTINQIRSAQQTLQDRNSFMYNEILIFLTNRNQSSYLLKGWINAAINHFLIFINSL